MFASIENLHFHKMTHQFMSMFKLKLRNFRIYLHLKLLNTPLFKRKCLVLEEKHFHLQIKLILLLKFCAILSGLPPSREEGLSRKPKY